MTTINEVDQLLTKEEVAHILKKNLRWVESKRDNPLPRVKIGHHVRFKTADVQAYIDSNTATKPEKRLTPLRAGRTAA